MTELEQEFLSSLLEGQTIKCPCETRKTAEEIRFSMHEIASRLTEEPIEILVLGQEPQIEVWVRKLAGGRPQVWMCGCGMQGTEEEMKEHVCRRKS